MITPIPASVIPDEWGWLGPMIAKTYEYCAPEADWPAMSRETFERLQSGQYEAAVVHMPHASGVVISELCVLDGVKVLWLPFIAGKTTLPPRAFVRFMRKMMVLYEDMAREQGCEEIRIGGRDWSRVFPDFERFDEVPNRMRKRL